MGKTRTPRRPRAAAHRPAVKKRRFRHDELVAVDLFSGFGGLTSGIKKAGFTTIMAANHVEYKVQVHEANHPEAEHWIADLVDKDAADYHDVRQLPPGDLLAAGVSCTNHSQANSQKAYEEGLSLFDVEDPDHAAKVTKSEKDRATANCVLHYAAVHHPRLILVECTTELQSWGPAIPGKPKVGDGSTFRWWLRQLELLGYKHRILYLNSMFFGVPQSRDRLYIAFWDRKIPTPDLDHRPHAWCGRCDTVVEGVWTWKTGVPPTGSVRYGKQYEYRCPRCRRAVVPPMTPSLAALDLTNLGPKIGDRPKPLRPATMARAQRCMERFADFPAIRLPGELAGTDHPWATGAVVAAHRHNGDGQHIGRPMDTVTATEEKALISTGALMVAAGNSFEREGSNCRSRGTDQPMWSQTATNQLGLVTPPIAMAVDNWQGAPRGVDEALPTQVGSETLGLVSARVMPNRTNATSADASEPMATAVAGAGGGGLGLLTAAGTIKNNGGIEEAGYRAHPVSDPLGAVTASSSQALLFGGWWKDNGKTALHPVSDPVGTLTAHDTTALMFGGWYKQNGGEGTETAPHPMSDPLGTLTGRDTTGLLVAEWKAALAELALEDCHFRMMQPHEVGRGCGFDVDFPSYGYSGEFIVWGSNKDQVDGFGNAVSPAVGHWIGDRLRAALHGAEA